jgi:uridine kinase
MPIGYNRDPFTLQEKIDKAIKITWDIRDAHNAEFMRKFLLELIEKAYVKLPNDSSKSIGEQVETLKRELQ